jgi:hypothetical protein
MFAKAMRYTGLAILLTSVFLSGLSLASDMDNYLGSECNGNYVWGGAMNLAWRELNDNILHEKLKLNTDDKPALEMVDKLNRSPLTKNDLDEKSYYVKSGFGQQTIDIINKDSRKKFPGKNFKDLQDKLQPTDIISYAYFLKEVTYWTKFDDKQVMFENKRVKGFYANGSDQRSNIRVLKYWDDGRFIISLRLQNNGDELFLAKGFDVNKPEEIVSEIYKYNSTLRPPINTNDQFEMPKLHLNHNRSYVELINKSLLNDAFKDYLISKMFENIKFDMDHRGARVENEAVIEGLATARMPQITRRFIMDKPFWVVMKRKDSQHPYFLLGVKNTELMEKGK